MSEWAVAPERPELSSGEVHVWRIPLDPVRPAAVTLGVLLSRDEVARANQLARESDRGRYVAARGMLRIVLGRYLGVPGEVLRFAHGPTGKPVLAGSHGSRLSFNVSHSHGLALIAVAPGAVGVDVERLREVIGWRAIARRYFSTGERAAIAALPNGRQADAFLRCWTRKEAFIKAHGEGLSFPLDQFEVSVSADAPARLLAVDGETGEASRWSLASVDPGPGYVGAVVLAGRGVRLKCWQAPGHPVIEAGRRSGGREDRRRVRALVASSP